MNSSYKESKKNRYFHTTVILFLGLVTFNKLAYSQQANIQASDDYTKTSIVHQDETSKALKLADDIRRTNPLKFQKILTMLANKNSFTDEQRHWFDFLTGYGYVFNGQLDKAEKQFKSLITSNADELIKFRASYTLVHVYAVRKMWFEGLALVASNIKTAEVLNNIKRKNEHLITTITFYKKMQQYDLSLYYIHQLSAQTLSPKLDCLAKQLTIESMFHLNKLSSSDPAIFTATQSCEKINDKMVSSIIRVYQARAFLVEQNTNGAINSLMPFIEDVKNTHYPELITGVNNILSEAYWQANDITNSKYFAEQAALTNASSNNVSQSAKTFKLLYLIAKKENKPYLALSYHEKYAAFDKIDSADIKNKNLSFELAKNKHLVQQSEIQLLNKQNNLLAAEQKLATTKVDNRHLVIVLLTFIIVMLALAGIRSWKIHKKVKALSEYDELTGIYNRRHFTHASINALEYCQHDNKPLCLIMFDLDLFKKINDTFGHLCGDWALKEVTKACERIGRQNDIFARLGGEEFCLLLPSCEIDIAILRAEACRVAIEEIITEQSGHDFTITASFGVTDVKRSGFSLEKLISDADQATYTSKHAGRNRVTVFEVPEEDELANLDPSWNF